MSIQKRRGSGIGSSGGAAYPANAGRRTGPADAGGRRPDLRGQVPEQPATPESAGQRVAGISAGGGGGIGDPGSGAGGSLRLAGREYAGTGDRPGQNAGPVPVGFAVRVKVCGRADAGTGGGLSARGTTGRGKE